MHYIDGDTKNLMEYFGKRLDVKMKRSIEIVCISKNIFTGQNKSNTKQFQIKQTNSYNTKKGIYIKCRTKDSLEIKCLVKAILSSPH